MQKIGHKIRKDYGLQVVNPTFKLIFYRWKYGTEKNITNLKADRGGGGFDLDHS